MRTSHSQMRVMDGDTSDKVLQLQTPNLRQITYIDVRSLISLKFDNFFHDDLIPCFPSRYIKLIYMPVLSGSLQWWLWLRVGLVDLQLLMLLMSLHGSVQNFISAVYHISFL